MRLWWATISAGGRPRLAVVVSDDHLVMTVIAGDYSGLPGRIERWLRGTTVALRARADGPARWGPSDLRALYSKITFEPGLSAVRLVDMTEPEPTTCTLHLTVAILERRLAQSADSVRGLYAA